MADTKYDVFLSHNSDDKAAVRQLAQLLRKERLHPFLDEWYLAAGDPKVKALHEIDRSAAMVVFMGPSGAGPWHAAECERAITKQIESPGTFRVFGVLLPGSRLTQLPVVLQDKIWLDFRNSQSFLESTSRDFEKFVKAIQGKPPGPGTPTGGRAKAVDVTRAAPPVRRETELALLCDRREQTIQIRDALARCAASTKPRPIVCFVDGTDSQGHDYLVRRLGFHDLPRWLQLEQRHEYVLDLPLVPFDPSLRHSPRFQTQLRRSLAEELQLSGNAPIEALGHKFNRHPGPVLVATDCFADDWRADGSAKLTDFLKFWSDWPELEPRTRVVVCVNFKSEDRPSPGPGGVWGWLFRKHDGDDGRMRSEIDQIAATNYPGIMLLKLPRLKDVTSSQFRDWRKEAAVRKFCDDDIQLDAKLKKRFAALPASTQRGVVMDAVVAELQLILREY